MDGLSIFTSAFFGWTSGDVGETRLQATISKTELPPKPESLQQDPCTAPDLFLS